MKKEKNCMTITEVISNGQCIFVNHVTRFKTEKTFTYQGVEYLVTYVNNNPTQMINRSTGHITYA